MDDRTKTVVASLGVVAFMGAMGFAAVPLYDLFCRVTGYGGTTQVGSAGTDVQIIDEMVTVRFDASKAADMPWRFEPEQREITLRMGEVGLAFYSAHNPTDQPVAGTASYNVTPLKVGQHFVKIDCFCFTEQVLQPGETVQMPVTFYVDPAILDDKEAEHVREITLSYTFFKTELPEETTEVSAAGAAQSEAPLANAAGGQNAL